METPKPQAGTWTLTAPDGRYWEGMTPLAACGAEQSERVPADVALARILEAAKPTPDEVDAQRYRWLREMHDSTDAVTLWHVRGAYGKPIASGALDAEIDAAMR